MRRPIVFVLLAGLAAMVAAVLVYSALKNADNAAKKAQKQSVSIIVAANDLPLGTKIDQSELKKSLWPSDSVPEGAFTDPKQVIGSYVKNSFVANEPIVAPKLFIGEKTAGVMPLLIPFGMRAVSVPVDEVSDIAGFVQPHTRVDVLVALSSTGGGGESKPLSKIVLQNVEVLAVAQEIEKKKDEPDVVKTVTLLVSPQEAERLELASHEGTLRLAMRNYNDNKIVLTSGADLEQLLHSYSIQPVEPALPPMPEQQPVVHEEAPPPPVVSEVPQKVEVEILRNGKSSESVSFVNEATKGSSHAPKAPDGAQEPSNGAVMPPESAPAPSAPPPRISSAEGDSAAAMLASGDRKTDNSGASAVRYVPVPKTIDVP